MNSRGYGHAAQAYQQVGLHSEVHEANPHQLIRLLMEGALSRIALARAAMGRGDTARKGQLIGKAIDIIEGLRISLDAEQGGELAANLELLYAYMNRRLLEANLRNQPEPLDEVSTLLGEIKDAWDAIPLEFRQAGTDAAAVQRG